MVSDPRRNTPRTDVVLADPRLRAASDRLGPRMVRGVVAATLERVRAGELPPPEAADAAVASLPEAPPSLGRVVNATGVLIHPNLGPAPLTAAAMAAVTAAAGYAPVELDLATGTRGRRGAGAAAAIAELVPQADAVHVVNSNAAALMLVAA